MQEIIEAELGLQISQEVKDNQRMVLDRAMVGVGDKYLHAIIVESLATSAHNVINHEEWVEICIHCLHSCLIDQMIMALRSRERQVLVF